MMKIKAIGKIAAFGSKHSVEILTGLAIAGLGLTVFTAIKAAPKVQNSLEEYAKDKEATKLGLVVEVAKDVWLPTLAGCCTIGCIFATNHINAAKIAGLTASVAYANEKCTHLIEQVHEKCGEEEAKKLEAKAMSKLKTGKSDLPDDKMMRSMDEEYWFVDSFDGQEFKSTRNKVQAGANVVSSCMLRNELYSTHNELCQEWGTKPSYAGSVLGHNVEDGPIELDLSELTLTIDGKPAIYIKYRYGSEPKLVAKHGYYS